MYWLSLMVCGMMFITFSRLLVFGCYFVAAVLVCDCLLLSCWYCCLFCCADLSCLVFVLLIVLVY